MATNRELTERMEKVEAEIAEMRDLLEAKTDPKPVKNVVKSTTGRTGKK